MNQEKTVSVPDEVVMNKIFMVRGQKVMLDRDLAELYGVDTKVLKQAVRRNITRFPDDFMFEMDKEELECLRSTINLRIKNEAPEAKNCKSILSLFKNIYNAASKLYPRKQR